MPLSQNVISESLKNLSHSATVADSFVQNPTISGSGLPAVCPSQGGEVPLDLFNGHLTDSFPAPAFIPASRGLPSELEPKNWFCRPGHDPSKDFDYVAKVQRFKSGGFEVTLLQTDLKQIAARMDAPRRTGSRVLCDQDENNVVSSVNRSKKRIRHLIKSMGCDRLLTLTRRENDPSSFWAVQDWAAAWDRFNRSCKKMGVALVYVAVLERHKKGNYHLHAAISGRINVNHIRKIWLSCCGGGKGCGNVDISMKQGLSAHKRRAGLAKYVSKYVSKQLGQTEFNKKRYWSSRHKLPDAVRYILSADDVKSALVEFSLSFGLEPAVLLNRSFLFSMDTCAWFSFDDDLLSPPPF